jgi:hypothetical protein
MRACPSSFLGDLEKHCSTCLLNLCAASSISISDRVNVRRQICRLGFGMRPLFWPNKSAVLPRIWAKNVLLFAE